MVSVNKGVRGRILICQTLVARFNKARLAIYRPGDREEYTGVVRKTTEVDLLSTIQCKQSRVLGLKIAAVLVPLSPLQARLEAC